MLRVLLYVATSAHYFHTPSIISSFTSALSIAQ